MVLFFDQPQESGGGGPTPSGLNNEYMAEMGPKTQPRGDNTPLAADQPTPQEKKADAPEEKPIAAPDQKVLDAIEMPKVPSAVLPTTKETMKKFEENPNKAQALKDLGPTFQDSVDKADQNYTDVVKVGDEATKKLLPLYKAMEEDVGRSSLKVRQAFNTVPKEQQPVVEALILEAQKDPTQSARIMKEIEKISPDLAKAFEEVDAKLTKHRPVIDKLEELEKTMKAVVTDCIETRRLYGLAARAGGDKPLEARIIEELKGMSTGSLPPKKEKK